MLQSYWQLFYSTMIDHSKSCMFLSSRVDQICQRRIITEQNFTMIFVTKDVFHSFSIMRVVRIIGSQGCHDIHGLYKCKWTFKHDCKSVNPTYSSQLVQYPLTPQLAAPTTDLNVFRVTQLLKKTQVNSTVLHSEFWIF